MSVMPGAAVPAKSTVPYRSPCTSWLGLLRRLAQPGELLDQFDRPLPVRRTRRHPRPRRQGVQRSLLPRRAVGGDEHVDVGPRRDGRLGQEPRAFQLGRRLVQPHRGRNDLVVPGFGGAGDEGVGAPTRDHVPAVGRPHRPGQPDTVDEQRLANLRRPRGAGVVGDHGQHDFTAAPAALPARARAARAEGRLSPNAAST